jgi:hypothetical protein
MKVMVLVKATKDSEAGVMPTTELLTAMGKFNEELAKAGILLAADGLRPTSKAARVRLSGTERTLPGPFYRDHGTDRGLLALAGQVTRGCGLGQALPRPTRGGMRDRNPPGVRGRRL